MRYTLHKEQFGQRMSQVFSSTDAIKAHLADNDVKLTDSLHKWLGRLRLLHGVPFNYLVPDETMLPPESIRFFYVDVNWINALLDGAYSIGRNLTNATASKSLNQDKATFTAVRDQSLHAAQRVRSTYLGTAPASGNFDVVSGFLLRSSLVTQYPGLGVNVFAAGSTPEHPLPLEILRFEALGPGSDTMICLVEGDIYQADLHEAPEQLHYGIDAYEVKDGAVSAMKALRTFTISGSDVTIHGDDVVKQDISDRFRPNAPRTLKMGALAALISEKAGKNVPVNSSEMGFEMTEGVGMVSFIRK
jgi:hypothetical protein